MCFCNVPTDSVARCYVFLEASWSYFCPGARNTSKYNPGSFLEPLLDLGPEVLQNCLLEVAWSHFWPWDQKYFKMSSWKLPGDTFGLDPRNVSKWSLWSLLEPLLSLGSEMHQNGLLEAFWSYFWAWARNAWKQPPGDLLELLLEYTYDFWNPITCSHICVYA